MSKITGHDVGTEGGMSGEWVDVQTQAEFDQAVAEGRVPCVREGEFTAYGSAQVRAYGSAQVTAYGSAQVRAYGSAQVTASDSAQVTASDSAQVTASRYVAVTKNKGSGVIVEGGVLIEIPPIETVDEWIDYYAPPTERAF